MRIASAPKLAVLLSLPVLVPPASAHAQQPNSVQANSAQAGSAQAGSAQVPRPQTPTAQAPRTTAGKSAASAGTPAVAAADTREGPILPQVSDPMLEPVPPAEESLGTWQEAVTLIKARSVELRNAFSEVKRAEGQWRVALAQALTTINVNGTASHLLVSPSQGIVAGGTFVQSSDTVTVSATVVQPLINVAVWHNIGTASTDVDVAKLSVEEVKRTITTAVANNVVAVVVAERVAELNRIGLRSALERLELTRKRFELGTQTALDVARAKQDVDAARATLVQGDESLRRSREALGLSLGVAKPLGVRHNVDINELGRSLSNLCAPLTDVNDRPDIVVGRGRVISAERRHDNVWLQFLPTLNLASNLNSTFSNAPSSPITVWNIQGVLSVPLWEGGARYGNLRSTEAQVETAMQNVEGAKRTAINEIRQARRAIDVAEQALEVARAQREHAQEVDTLQRISFQEGRGTSLELVLAASTLRQSELTLAQRELDVVRARVAAVTTLARCTW